MGGHEVKHKERRPSSPRENKNHLEKKHELWVPMMTPSYWPNLGGGGGEEKQQEKEETVQEGYSPEASPSPSSSTRHPNKLGAHNHMASSRGERPRGGDSGEETKGTGLVIYLGLFTVNGVTRAEEGMREERRTNKRAEIFKTGMWTKQGLEGSYWNTHSLFDNTPLFLSLHNISATEVCWRKKK